MKKMKNRSTFLFAILITMFFCTSCIYKGGGKSRGEEVEESVENTYEDSSEESPEDTDNPLNIIGMKPEWKNKGRDWWSCEKITVQTPNGNLKYSDEDAELYYDDYALIFTWAYLICSGLYSDKDQSIRNYLKDNLLEVVCNLPLDDSYPEKVREHVNKVYYNKVDDINNTLCVDGRGFGYKKYAYYYEGYSLEYHVECTQKQLIRVKRDKDDNGILVIG